MSCLRCLEEGSCIFVSVWSDSQRVRHIPCQYAMNLNGTEKVRCTARAAVKPRLPALRHSGERALWLACRLDSRPVPTQAYFCCPEKVQRPGGSVLQYECGQERGQCNGKQIDDPNSPWPSFTVQTLVGRSARPHE
jgi:hypothetical protein